jgi:hypothetical protein
MADSLGNWQTQNFSPASAGDYALFKVTRSPQNALGYQAFEFSSFNESAVAPIDYRPAAGTILFGPSEAGTKTIKIKTFANTPNEPTETFGLQVRSYFILRDSVTGNPLGQPVPGTEMSTNYRFTIQGSTHTASIDRDSLNTILRPEAELNGISLKAVTKDILAIATSDNLSEAIFNVLIKYFPLKTSKQLRRNIDKGVIGVRG